jgi:mannitol-specific phosphotransferase system IIBC component
MARLDDLPADTRVLIVPPTLVEAAQQAAPQARVVALTEMVNAPAYDVLLDELKREQMREITGLG